MTQINPFNPIEIKKKNPFNPIEDSTLSVGKVSEPFSSITTQTRTPVQVRPVTEAQKLIEKYNLPASTISQGKTPIAQEPSMWNRVAKTLLPKGVEDYFGLNEPINKPLTPMDAENAKQSLWREQRKEANIAQVDKPLEVYTPPKNFGEKLWEATKYGNYASNVFTGFILPAIGTVSEQAGIRTDNPKLREWGEQFADKTLEKESRRASGQSMADVPAAFEGGLKDPRFYAKTISQTIGFMATVFGTGVAVSAVAGPGAGTVASFGVGAALESSGAYQDMLDKGVNPNDAESAAQIYGTLASLIENATGIRPAAGMKGLTEDFAIEAAKNSGVKKFIKTWLQEGVLEEGSQQLVQNLVTKFVDKNQKVFENVAESMVAGLIGALPLAGGATIIGNKKNRDKILDTTKNIPVGLSVEDISGQTNDKSLKEAKKYKSAEEFVEAQPLGNLQIINKEGIIAEIDRIDSKIKGGGTNSIGRYFENNPEIKSLVGSAEPKSYGFWQKIGAKLETPNLKGQPEELSSFILKRENFFEQSKYKTKSQLTDIWNKAQEKPSLIQEAKKYKNAEDFVKAQKENAGAISEETRAKLVGDGEKALVNGTNERRYFEKQMRGAGLTEEQIASVLDNTPKNKYEKYNTEDVLYGMTEHNLKIKQQLTDIWNKANKITIESKKDEKSVGELEEDYFANRPGHQKFNDYVDTMAKNNTIFPEEVVILKTLFEGTSDKVLNDITFNENSRLKNTLARYNSSLKRIQMQKGLAKKELKPGTKTFAHEYGHAAWDIILTTEERALITKIYKGMSKEKQRSVFKGHDENYKYYAKNEKEFWAQSFSDYVLENKIPNNQMEPLLKRVSKVFFNGLKKLVNRQEVPAVLKLRPLYEKILTGDTSTPLEKFAAKEPPSFKQNLQRMFENITKTTSQTKEVPVDQILNQETKSLFETEQIGNSPIETVNKLYEDVNNLYPEIIFEPPEVVLEGDKRTPVSQRVNMLDKIRTPWRIMEKFGVREPYRKLIKAYEAYVKELPKNIDIITAWAERVSKESNERIFRFLDGEKVVLNPEETQVAGEIKTWLANWADRLGMDKDARISEYITHIFPLKDSGEIPEGIVTLIDKKVAKEIYDPFLLQRKGAEGYLKDTWRALDAYVKRATRKVNIDPALKEFNEATAHLTEVSQIDYIEKRISALNMRPTKSERELDNLIRASVIGDKLGPRPTMVMTTSIRRTISRAKIGASMVSFAKNLTQGVNTFADLGTRYTTRGYMDLVKFGDKELKEHNVLISPFIEDRQYNAIKKFAEKSDKVLFLNMTASELVNRGASYYGAKAKFLDGKISPKEFRLGLGREMPKNYVPTLEDAIDYGKFVSEKTQFLFGPLDNPAILSGPLARTAAHFQTFALKQTEFVGNLIADKEYAKFARYMISSMLLFQYIAGAFGMKWDDSFRTWRWGLPPAIQFIIDLWKGGILGEDKYGNKLDAGERAKMVGKSLFTNVVPGGAQMKRGYEGFTTVNQGAGRNAAGNLLYKVDKTPMNYIRGTLFGKYNLPASKDYYKKKEDRAKSKKSTANPFDPI